MQLTILMYAVRQGGFFIMRESAGTGWKVKSRKLPIPKSPANYQKLRTLVIDTGAGVMEWHMLTGANDPGMLLLQKNVIAINLYPYVSMPQVQIHPKGMIPHNKNENAGNNDIKRAE